MPQNRTASRYGTPWSREELILAFELYCRIPFQRTKANNPEVQELADLIDRTPASVARKLGNFGASDPGLREQRIAGLTHASKMDRAIWSEFSQDWNGLVWEASRLRLSMKKEKRSEAFVQPSGPSEVLRTVKQRVHQAFFRSAVLSSYDQTCCVTGLRIPQCLVASHIVPWSEDEKHRADPTNGLCFSATFDRLFDAGLMTISDELTVAMASDLAETSDNNTKELIWPYGGKGIILPRRFMPSLERLRWHQKNIFRGVK